MKTFRNLAAQGDMLIRRVDNLPEDAQEIQPENDKLVVAHSETGHHHFINAADARFYGTSDPMVCYLVVDGMATLEHARDFHTHEPIQIPKGTFQIRRQREYTPQGYRAVAD